MKNTLLVLLALVAVLVGVIATRPNTFHVERSVTIAAPAAAVHDEVADLHRFEAWSPWSKMDPQMKTDFSGAPAGVGQVYHWTGNDKVGEGRMTVTGDAPDQVGLRLDFIKPFASTSNVTFALAPETTGTRVTWNMDGPMNFISKAMCLVQPMDKMIGPDFERGLGNLKSVVEAKAAVAPAPADTAAARPQ